MKVNNNLNSQNFGRVIFSKSTNNYIQKLLNAEQNEIIRSKMRTNLYGIKRAFANRKEDIYLHSHQTITGNTFHLSTSKLEFFAFLDYFRFIDFVPRKLKITNKKTSPLEAINQINDFIQKVERKKKNIKYPVGFRR